MKLIIVESPTKSKSIAKFVESGYQVLSSYGHVRDLPKSELGIDIEKNFEPKYVIPTKSRKTVTQLKKSAKEADLIILATDEDREGEAIAWHILHILKPKNHQRIVFHEITKKAILDALKNPRQIDENLVEAQQARRMLDRLVGYKLSPFLWKKVFKGLSAGRVQSVAVKLIADREDERKKFNPEEYWSIDALLKKDSEELTAKLLKRNGKIIPKTGIKNQQDADGILEILKQADYKIANIEKKERKRYPTPPFTTSTLQQTASSKLGFSSKQTMMIAQQLYEGIRLGSKEQAGLITYHRTDSFNLSLEAVDSARDFIGKSMGKKYLPEKAIFYRTKSKQAQEAHEAIRPTDPKKTPEDVKEYLKPRQYKLYKLIWNRFIACQMMPAVFDAMSIDIDATNKKEKFLFRANGSIVKFDGFLRVYPMKFEESILPAVNKDDLLKLIKLIPEQHFTQPPARYGEATLIKVLEEYGIGRPSTYAPIISTIQSRRYVEKDEQKKFFPTEVGLIVNNILKEHFPEIVDVDFTAEMEKSLDRIAQGKQSRTKLLADFYTPFEKNLSQKYEEVEKKKMEQPTDKICPECGTNLVIKMGRFGKFYACPKFPECKHTEAVVNSTKVACPECGKGELVERKTRRGRTFYSCNKYPKCKFALWDKPVDQKCPECGSIMTEKGKNIKCSNKECVTNGRKEEPTK